MIDITRIFDLSFNQPGEFVAILFHALLFTRSSYAARIFSFDLSHALVSQIFDT